MESDRQDFKKMLYGVIDNPVDVESVFLAFTTLWEALDKRDARIAELEAERNELKSIHLDFFRYAKRDALDAVLAKIRVTGAYTGNDIYSLVNELRTERK